MSAEYISSDIIIPGATIKMDLTTLCDPDQKFRRVFYSHKLDKQRDHVRSYELDVDHLDFAPPDSKSR